MLELLVVVAIIGLMLALLMPSIQHARERSRRLQCANNLKQKGLSQAASAGALIPNDPTPDMVISIYLCPSDGGPPLVQGGTKGRSNYAGVSGDGTSPGLHGDGDVYLHDGRSVTFDRGEQTSGPVDPDKGWADSPAPTASCENPLNSRHENGETGPDDFGSWHPGGANFLMADGAVRFVSESIDLGTYHALATAAKGELVYDF
jgi:prepilin-type processing-associated H-X9-DG protein